MTLDLFPETANPHANLLPYDGIVSDFGRIFTVAEADRYFEILQRDIPWQHDKAVIFGKHIITAREVAWYGDTSYNYGYSGANRIALPWGGILPELKNRVEAAIANICPTRFNSCLLNRYNNGNEGMAWHSDEGQGLAKDSAIASLSLGAARKFAFKHKKSKEKREMWLEHGQLIVMHGETQKHWLRPLQNSPKCGGLLVFAQIISDIKKRRNLGKTWISAFFAFEKSCISFFTKPRGNARFFVESCRVLIGF